MKKEKGFAISIILYSLVFLIITVLFIILGILKTRYGVSNKTRKAVIEEINASDYAARVFKRNISRGGRMPVWIDTMDTPDVSDNVIYVAQITNSNCRSSYNCSTTVENNYVWYSGKLWRIVTVYPDGTMKLVTEDVIAHIHGGAYFPSTFLYQWLNEDFLDTLYNSDKIVEDATWNFTADTVKTSSSNAPTRPESLPNQKTITAKVGLLNAYELYNTRYTKDSPTNFNSIKFNVTQYKNDNREITNTYLLHNGTFNDGIWWLLNSDSAGVNCFDTSLIYAMILSVRDANFASYGVRPSIVLKRDVMFKGKGTKSDPYTIVGDKAKPIYNETLLNTRSSGEYVKFDNATYRIIGTEEGNTRLIFNFSISFTTMAGIASSGYWGRSTNDPFKDYNPYASNLILDPYIIIPRQENYYSDYYFNNVWYYNISSNYKNMMVDGAFYQGSYSDTRGYKGVMCIGKVNIPTKECTRYPDGDDRKFVGKVGLPRIGEMFSGTIITTTGDDSVVMLPINNCIRYPGTYDSCSSSVFTKKYRPVINVSSAVKITGGNGTQDSPFEISL